MNDSPLRELVTGLVSCRDDARRTAEQMREAETGPFKHGNSMDTIADIYQESIGRICEAINTLRIRRCRDTFMQGAEEYSNEYIPIGEIPTSGDLVDMTKDKTEEEKGGDNMPEEPREETKTRAVTIWDNVYHIREDDAEAWKALRAVANYVSVSKNKRGRGSGGRAQRRAN